MNTTPDYEAMYRVALCSQNGVSPIPQEGSFDEVKSVEQISGFSHSVGTCALKQGACKLTLNVKNGIIQEALVEVVGCSGMTHSASMAAEILPGKTILEAMNTDLVCDAINVAMREMFLMLAYGRSQSAFTEGGLAVGSGMQDLGNGYRSQLGTSYGTLEKGPRYLEMTEGYIKEMALDEKDRVIGYSFVNFGTMMSLIADGVSVEEAYKRASGEYGRFSEAQQTINPRKE